MFFVDNLNDYVMLSEPKQFLFKRTEENLTITSTVYIKL